ncbi:peptidase inhibitor family I36 protein [Streptomyces cocklensis]|uniref:Uncharacterized protein n=1 Tax=Actinacidiphila cocklensis TaxID=887465 RepID=A0A9W4DQI5_9ACTN|nr:peptidase inhibitor family I36 protein [Actinacidiphila cocklensis]CAG6394184.1 hypothetical protein SCOCK_250003 [Actinacidiphila cocklensis]
MGHLPDSIRGSGSSIINNSGRTARVYAKDNYFGSHVCGSRLSCAAPSKPSNATSATGSLAVATTPDRSPGRRPSTGSLDKVAAC